MIETLQIVALLCQVHSGQGAYTVDLVQKECHIYYAACLALPKPLLTCMKERVIK